MSSLAAGAQCLTRHMQHHKAVPQRSKSVMPQASASSSIITHVGAQHHVNIMSTSACSALSCSHRASATCFQRPERRHLCPAGGPEAARGGEEPRASGAAEAVGGCSADQDAAGDQPPACPATELQQQMALLQQRVEQASAVAVELQQAHAATGRSNAGELQQRQQARPLCLTDGMSVATCNACPAGCVLQTCGWTGNTLPAGWDRLHWKTAFCWQTVPFPFQEPCCQIQPGMLCLGAGSCEGSRCTPRAAAGPAMPPPSVGAGQGRLAGSPVPKNKSCGTSRGVARRSAGGGGAPEENGSAAGR